MRFADIKVTDAYRKIKDRKKRINFLIAHDNALIAEQDKRGRLVVAERKGKEEGLEIGRKIGIEIGIKIARIDNIIGLHQIGIPIPIIAKALNISETDIFEAIENHGRT